MVDEGEDGDRVARESKIRVMVENERETINRRTSVKGREEGEDMVR